MSTHGATAGNLIAQYLEVAPQHKGDLMTTEFIDRIVRPAERETITGIGDMQGRRLEARGDHPLRFKICPDSGKYGATGWMLSSLLAWNQWRAAGGPGSWPEWWAAHRAEGETEARAAAREVV